MRERTSLGGDSLQPEGIALDTAGNLFVADAGDNRVTVYFTPFASRPA